MKNKAKKKNEKKISCQNDKWTPSHKHDDDQEEMPRQKGETDYKLVLYIFFFCVCVPLISELSPFTW